jgi:hypothetical protein
MSGNSPEVKRVAWQAAVEERPGRLEPVELRKLPRRFITLERDRGHLWGRRVARRGERVHARQGSISSMFVAKLVGVMFVGLERVLQSVAISGNQWQSVAITLELCLKDSSASFHATIAFLFIASWQGFPARSALTRTPAVWASTNCAGASTRPSGVIRGHH